ncbi:MAG TPA: hypothetical protein VFF32_07185 [Dermatophilaceae bacterium]|nr:hypothetical protein [Dermatophilaceae bacterium]
MRLGRLEVPRTPDTEGHSNGHQKDQDPKQHQLVGWTSKSAQHQSSAGALTPMMASARNH